MNIGRLFLVMAVLVGIIVYVVGNGIDFAQDSARQTVRQMNQNYEANR